RSHCCAAVTTIHLQNYFYFVKFPLKDSKRLIQWLKAVQRDNWTPTKYSFLCSEHFTKDSFSKRLEDQHRLLKPTAVPSIFHLTEKKRGAGGHGRTRRKDASKATGGVRGHSSAATGRGAAGWSPSSSGNPMAKPESRRLKRAALQGEATPRAAQEAASQEQAQQALERTPGDGLATMVAGSQGKAEASATDASDESATSSIEGGVADKSGISMDDFTPPGSGACKFIGSLHSYSFSSKHTRERPSVPREPIDRKRPKKDVEPSCSGSSLGPDKGLAQSPPSSSLTATPQKPSQSPSAPPADVTPKPATEAVQSEHSDASPMSINEVILSASGACKLIDSLHSYCFSSRQNKSQVCCLREQVEKKNGELKSLRQRVSRSDSQVRKLQEKLDELRRVSIPYPSGLLSPSRGQYRSLAYPCSLPGTWIVTCPGALGCVYPPLAGPLPGSQPVMSVWHAMGTQALIESFEDKTKVFLFHSPAQITRKFRLNSEGKLEQTVSMATTTQPMTQHLHVTYKKVTP
uniref:THAP-type domain-containing protein n=1 Tax=Gorilla gorilla gorilla TaxID=9595 RepID=G3RI16_GORGO